jgi:hypothetical protein
MVRFLSLLSIFVFISSLAIAQQRKKSGFSNKAKKDQKKFLDKQWWLGFKAGVNLSDVSPEKRYTVLTPTNYEATATDKQYNSYDKTGSHVTLEITFFYKNFNFSLQPTYSHSRFTYSNELRWTSTENAAERLELKFEQAQQLNYADFPLVAKYEFDLPDNRIKPYLHAGAFYSLLIDAKKTVTESGTDYASGGTNKFTNEPVIVGAKDLFQNFWGFTGGGGIAYNLGNVRLVLDVTYKHGMSNIANPTNRFSNDRLNGIGDAQDDLLLRNVSFSAGCLFPLRFLGSNFKSVD